MNTKPADLPLAILASAISFPAMLLERLQPRWPSSEDLLKNMPAGAEFTQPYHYLKNITTECVRADAQWWSKCLAFISITPWLILAGWVVFEIVN